MSKPSRRLILTHPTAADLDALHLIFADPRVWTHLPSGRHSTPEATMRMIEKAQEGWRDNGLDEGVVRDAWTLAVIGWAGCRLVHDQMWNLSYRLAPEWHGRGLATELSRAAIH